MVTEVTVAMTVVMAEVMRVMAGMGVAYTFGRLEGCAEQGCKDPKDTEFCSTACKEGPGASHGPTACRRGKHTLPVAPYNHTVT